MAVASLVLGIIALIGGLTGWAGVVCGILAIVFGAVGRIPQTRLTRRWRLGDLFSALSRCSADLSSRF